MSSARSNQITILKVFLHAGFFISGISTVLIGQVLPILSKKFALNDQQTAGFFPAQFAGSLAGTFLTNWFGKRGRFLTASSVGCFLMAVGVFLLNLGSFKLCLLGFFVNGLGIGLTLPAINMLILELSPLRATSALSILNFFWGFGAIVSQPFVDSLSRGSDIFLPTAILSGLLATVGIAIAVMPSALEPVNNSKDGAESEPDPPIWSNPIAWMIAGFNFIHVGFESAMGGWLKTYTERLETTAAMHLLPPILLYFLFFVIGRGVAPLFFRFLNENRMLIASLVITLAGIVTILSAQNVFVLGVGAAIAGFGTSSIFPTNMSRFTKTFGPTASRRATPFFICGTLGAAFTTWFIGTVSTRFDSLRAGMFMLLASVIVLLVLQFGLQLRTKRAALGERD
ncbi:MAG: MFS transporter [Acidobacteria bacterium]|nr:MFS transporter [Acidobacteriota bacterium]MBK8810206.1 MFS transporter [Acidobacteriota bacterium]